MDNENRGYNNQQQPNYGYGGNASYYNQGPPPQQWQSGPTNQDWPSYGNNSQGPPPQQYQNYQQGPPQQQYGSYQQGPPPQQYDNYQQGPPQQYENHQQGPPPQQYGNYQQGPPTGQQHSNHPPQSHGAGMPPGDDGADKGILDHVPFTNQHAQHEAAKHQHPLAALLNKEGTHISLDLVDAGDNVDQLIPTSQESTSFKPAYTVHYNLDDYDGQVLGAPPPDFASNKQKVVGSWNTHSWHKEKLKFTFPWGKWGFDPDKQEWLSDVKLLGGKDAMEFVVTDESEGMISESNGRKYVNFTLRCVDTSDSERRLVSMVKVKSYMKAHIEIPVKIIANKEQLDELIVVTLAVMDRQRDEMVVSY